jgi:hypothetical protein
MRLHGSSVTRALAPVMSARTWWVPLCLLALLCAQVPLTSDTADEYWLKAAFVYRFPQFVQWPRAAVEDARTLDVCVLRPNPFGDSLDRLVSGESLNGRPLRVRVLANPGRLDGCHVLFAGSGSRAAAALAAVKGRPVLTVGEADRFLEDGGIVLLKIVSRRVRFEVHAANARRAGLRIDAQLLNLASAVHGAQP